jgi:hypothetical protein
MSNSTQLRTIADRISQLVEMKVWIDATSVTANGCVLVAPPGYVFKRNLKHEISVQRNYPAPAISITHVEYLWNEIGGILDEGLELCEATAFCSCQPPQEDLAEQEDYCGYCLKDGEEKSENAWDKLEVGDVLNLDGIEFKITKRDGSRLTGVNSKGQICHILTNVPSPGESIDSKLTWGKED